MLQIDYEYLGRLAEGIYCRLDRMTEAMERCCRAAEAPLLRGRPPGNLREQQHLLTPITGIVRVTQLRANRRLLFFGVDGPPARLSLHSTVCLGGWILREEAGPLIFHADRDDPLQAQEWYAEMTAAGTVLTAIEAW